MISTIKRTLLFLTANLPDLKFEPRQNNDTLQFRQLDKTETGLIAQHPDALPHQASPGYFDHHLSEGARVYGAFAQGRLPVAWRLFRPHRMNFWGWARLEVSEDSWIGFGAFTEPDHRGRHVQQQLLSSAAEDLGESGVQRMVNFVEKENAPARKMHLRCGMRFHEEVSALNLPFGLKTVSANGRAHIGVYSGKQRFLYRVS